MIIDPVSLLLGCIAGAALGLLGAHLGVSRKLAAAILERERLRAELAASRVSDQQSREARQALSDHFAALSAEALRQNNQNFLDVAQQRLGLAQQDAQSDMDQRASAVAALVKPVAEALEKVESQIQSMERTREGAYQGLREQAGLMKELYLDIKTETRNLTRALRTPIVRGRWGEIQLRRVVELAGMLKHCDFIEQETAPAPESGARETNVLRPDMVIRLPGNKQIVVDAKAPLEAYLDSLDIVEESARRARLGDHARAIRNHIRQLSLKSYWKQFESSPDFVVLFLPGEQFFAAALEQDPALIETGVEAQVILATPTTLIALLRASFYGWRQEDIAENARQIAETGRTLYQRLTTLNEHFEKLGKSLNGAVGHYNQAIASLDSRVLVSARRLSELDPSLETKRLTPPPVIESRARE